MPSERSRKSMKLASQLNLQNLHCGADCGTYSLGAPESSLVRNRLKMKVGRPSHFVEKLQRKPEKIPAGTKHRSQVAGHCFTNTESILNIHKS